MSRAERPHCFSGVGAVRHLQCVTQIITSKFASRVVKQEDCRKSDVTWPYLHASFTTPRSERNGLEARMSPNPEIPKSPDFQLIESLPPALPGTEHELGSGTNGC